MNWPIVRKTLAWSIVAIALITFAVVSYLLFTGPHMVYQSNLRPHQALMPELPADTVPVYQVDFPAPTTQQAQSLHDRLKPTVANLARGRVAYEYYCIFCHDTNGSGNGEVGRSYTPKPTDLRDPKVQQLSDGELLRRTLTGEGHTPVLEQVIAPADRWYLVLYVRSLGPHNLAQAQR